MFEGSVDEVSTRVAKGWLFCQLDGTSITVEATLFGRVLGEARASDYRPDLEIAGLGDGLCGFNIEFDTPILNSEVPFVKLNPKGSNLNIPRTFEDSFRDLILDVLSTHPGAGRSRSMLGGLWTDRTDALQILAGRVHIGLYSTETARVLHKFIADGFTSFETNIQSSLIEPPLSLLANANTAAKDLAAIQTAASTLDKAVMSTEITQFLRSVFDDIPIIYNFQVHKSIDQKFVQPSNLEVFTSPTDVMLACLPLRIFSSARIDFLRDSHELPEFDERGHSRWIGIHGESDVLTNSACRLPIDSEELLVGRLYFISPGLIQRLAIDEADLVVTMLLSPKRNTPIRFLQASTAWQEVAVGEHARLRFG